jgi:hypothetical protein
VRREHEPRARVRGAQDAAEPAQQRVQAPQPPGEPRGPLVALGARRVAHLVLDVGEQRRAAVLGAAEQPERRVEPLAIEVRVEVAEAGRQAAAHLPVGGRVRAPRQPAAAVAQPEQRVELLDELLRGHAAAQRPDADRVARRRLVGDLEDRDRRCRAGSAGRRSRPARA